MKTKHTIIALTLLCLATASSQTFASCNQGKLTGIWFLGGASIDTAFGGNFGLYCKIKIDAGGPVLPGASSCQLSEDDSKVPVNVTGGNFTAKSNCQVTGYFRICQDEDCARLNINNAKLSDNGQVLLWTGRQGDELDNFQYLTGIKQLPN